MATTPARSKSARRGVHVVKLDDFKAKKEKEGSIEIEAAGVTYRIPPPELWDDEIMALSQEDDNLAVARRLIGEDRYDAFVEAGGSAAIVMGVIADAHGISLGE